VRAEVHTHERRTHARRGKPCHRGAVFDALRKLGGLKRSPFSVEHTIAGASPALVALSSMCYESRGVCALSSTHLSVELTLAGANTAIAALSLKCTHLISRLIELMLAGPSPTIMALSLMRHESGGVYCL